MSVNNLKCTECDDVTTDVCLSCGTAPLCETCRASVGTCAECDTEEDAEEEDTEEDDFYDDLDDDWDDGPEDAPPVGEGDE